MQHYESVFNDDTFYPALYGDFKRAKALVIVQSPYVTLQRIEKMERSMAACINRGIRFCVFVREPDEWSEGIKNPRVKLFRAAVEFLQSMGAHITIRPHIHEKYVIVDEDILYAGSLNVLSQSKSSEEMRRWQDSSRVRSVIREKRLHECAQCRTEGINMFPAEGDLQMQIARGLKAARLRLGLSQADVGALCGLDQRTISSIESGNRNFSMGTLSKLCKTLDINLLFAPWFTTPAASTFIQGCSKRTDIP